MPSEIAPRLRFAHALLTLIPCWTSCAELPDLDQRLDENVVITLRDRATDFASYRTFAMTEVRAGKVDAQGNVTDSVIDGVAAQALQAKVSELMVARGYQQVEREQSPELGMGIAVVQGTQSVSTSTAYWGTYYSAYWGYPQAGVSYPYAATYSYRTGTLALTLLDLRATQAGGGDLRVLWTALAYRALPEQGVISAEGVAAALEQAFQQSPYLAR